MKTLSYSEWAKYISELKEYYLPDSKTFLEIAAGNGKLAFYLTRVFSDIVLLDISQSMLSLIDRDLKRVCADMVALPLKGKFDFIYSTFDSINYLMNEDDLQKYFHEIYRILTPNGIFTFDATLENNSLKNLKRLNRKDKFQNILYIQKSFYDAEKRIHTNKFTVKLENDKIYEEVHLQKIYNFELYFELIEIAGLMVVDCFEAFTFDDANRDSERIQFILKRKYA
ncbi:MAG: class I SAM-dependent methyltransferase [Bacteroidetes bacterium]|nr:class I SAM-dependent methyltransferase [Bacteroidota bacterium]MBU1800349.1 class I SAM-dependent methyltransferase [Bacteroidota bacterium]